MKKLVCPSVQALFSRSQYRAVTARRNLADAPFANSRYTGCVATFPTAHTIVSFMPDPSPYECVCRGVRVLCVHTLCVRMRCDRREFRLPSSGRAR